jgi:hypothetical protein
VDLIQIMFPSGVVQISVVSNGGNQKFCFARVKIGDGVREGWVRGRGWGGERREGSV